MEMCYSSGMKKSIPLAEWLQTHSQYETARLLGITDGAIWQWVRGNRDISIERLSGGQIRAVERKVVAPR